MSQLPHDVELSRPLVHMHLRRFEAAGRSAGAASCRTTARRCGFFEVTPFAIDLTPDLVGEAARTLDDEPDLQTNSGKEVKR